MRKPLGTSAVLGTLVLAVLGVGADIGWPSPQPGGGRQSTAADIGWPVPGPAVPVQDTTEDIGWP